MSDPDATQPTPKPKACLDPGPTPTGYQRTQAGGFKWVPPSPERLALLLPQYEIQAILGHGGMGAVYKGVQKALDRPVAIKILPPEMDDEDGSYVERFKNEAKVMARFMHPAIVGVFDFGETAEGQLYIVMEYVDGTDVQKMIQSQGHLPPEHALAITSHVCDALRYAHEHGVIHRDIKPANILINMEGAVKVADFGLAKAEEAGASGLTKTGMAMGTPDYVAPEALMLGVHVDGRADLYAVGVMLYTMLTGRVPRGAFKPASVVNSEIDPRFDAIVQKAMQMDREERYQSSAEIRQDLDAIFTAPMMQAGGQSSAAIPMAVMVEKPVAKGPRPKATPALIGAVQSDVTPAKASSLTWVLPTALSAIVILGGAFFMRGKLAATPVEEAAPVAKKVIAATPVKVTEAPRVTPPKVVVSRKSEPKPVVSKPSDPQFPQGKWVKLFTKAEDLPADLRQAGVKFENGGLRMGQQKRKLPLPAELNSNYAVRARFLRHGLGENNRIILRQEGSNPEYYLLGFEGAKMALRQYKDTVYIPLADVKTPFLGAESEYSLQFGAVNDRLIGRYGDGVVASADGSQLRHGKAYIFGSEDIRDIEVINLDGLPEAEALKILGVDEKGNDLRNPAVAATSTQASPISNLQSSISNAASAAFPPGQWVNIDHSLLKDRMSANAEGWKKPSGGIIELPEIKGSNIGLRVRTRFVKEIPGNDAHMVQLRVASASEATPAHYAMHLSAGSKSVSIRKRYGAETPILLALGSTLMTPDTETLFEFAAVGQRLISRIDGVLQPEVWDDKLVSGHIGIRAIFPVKDIEVINLDGLPEAEALRILGVDEKGNDLRAAAIAQEKQAMEQAKVVDAMGGIPELKVLHEQFVKLQAERVTAPFELEVAKLNAGYVGGIEREIASEKKAGHLDGVIALEAEKKLIPLVGRGNDPAGPNAQGSMPPSTGMPIPAQDEASTTTALKELRGIYRAAYAKLETARAGNLKALTDPLDVRLKQIEGTLTQQDRIGDAKVVREYREGLGKATGPSAAVPTQTALGGRSALPAASLKVPKIKPDPEKSRQAAEYALSKGGQITIDQDGARIPINKAEDLPKGRWELIRVKFPGAVTDEDLRSVTQAVELKEFLCNDRAPGGTFTTLAPLANTSGLVTLHLHGGPKEATLDEAGYLLPSRETLQSFTWSGSQQRLGSLLAVIPEMKSLTYLFLPDVELTDDDLTSLLQLTSLNSLSFRGSKLTDTGAGHLAKFKSLIRLVISDPYDQASQQFTPAGLAAITKKHGGTLTLFNVGSFRSPHMEGMLRVIAADCPVLANLIIRGEVSPEALADLGRVKKLKHLDFGRATYKPIPLSVAHCQAISGIKSLEFLGVNDCAMSDEHVQALVGLKSLESLNLNRNPGITDASVPFFLELQNLETLSVGATSVTSSGVLKLAALKTLKALTIDSKNFPDADVVAFKKLRPDVTVTR